MTLALTARYLCVKKNNFFVADMALTALLMTWSRKPWQGETLIIYLMLENLWRVEITILMWTLSLINSMRWYIIWGSFVIDYCSNMKIVWPGVEIGVTGWKDWIQHNRLFFIVFIYEKVYLQQEMISGAYQQWLCSWMGNVREGNSAGQKQDPGSIAEREKTYRKTASFTWGWSMCCNSNIFTFYRKKNYLLPGVAYITSKFLTQEGTHEDFFLIHRSKSVSWDMKTSQLFPESCLNITICPASSF